MSDVRQSKINKILNAFLRPKFNRIFFLRLFLTAVAAYIFFGYVCRPMYLDGDSMYPTYRSGTLNFCWRYAYKFRQPQRGDVAVFRYAGQNVLLLKRIIGLPGETISIQSGKVYINGYLLDEPYVYKQDKNWNLKTRVISDDSYYVIGDNRSMPMVNHKFGEISVSRLEGTLLL